MANLTGFDATKVEPVDFSALPAGDYAAVITESETKPTKNGTGEYLQLKFQVTKGPHKNRVLFDRLNLTNQNQTAVQIARGTLSSICRAVNVLTPNDSSELHNIPLLLSVKTREYNGDVQNEIKGYKPLPEGWQPADEAAGETPW